MFTIRLFCAAGMSTSLLVRKTVEAAKEERIQLDIISYPVNEIEQNLDGADCVLIAPQINYMRDFIKELCDERGIPCDVIPMADYGMVNGKGVLKFAMDLAQVEA